MASSHWYTFSHSFVLHVPYLLKLLTVEDFISILSLSSIPLNNVVRRYRVCKPILAHVKLWPAIQVMSVFLNSIYFSFCFIFQLVKTYFWGSLRYLISMFRLSTMNKIYPRKAATSSPITHHINNDKSEVSFSWEKQLDIIAQVLSKLLQWSPWEHLYYSSDRLNMINWFVHLKSFTMFGSNKKEYTEKAMCHCII